ncbi:MAG: fasciclin domain-containing protein [Spirosomaceae bacterium]|nr:fasciclin domain-containing protein [Spirosomataceae bacterium]
MIKRHSPLFIALLLTVLALTQCKQDEPQPKSISDLILDQPDLGIFRAALQHTGLTDALKTGTFTVFAPSDEGFKASGIADAAAVTSQSPDAVRLLLRNHILNEDLPKANMKLGVGSNVPKMMSGATLFLSNVDSGIFLNQARATTTDLQATNGTVHVINRVIPIPSTRGIGQVIRNTPNYSLFRRAFERAIVGNPTLAEFWADSTGTKGQIYTVFIPTNTAMEAAGFNLARIAAESPINIARIVGYHIARGRYFSSLIPKDLPMFDATFSITTEFKSNGVFQITGRGNPTTGVNANPVTVTQADIQVNNGLVNVIDKVLIPR